MNIETPKQMNPLRHEGPLQVLSEWIGPEHTGFSVVIYKDPGLATKSEVDMGIKDIFGVMTVFKDSPRPRDRHTPCKEESVEVITGSEIVTEGVSYEQAKIVFDTLSK